LKWGLGKRAEGILEGGKLFYTDFEILKDVRKKQGFHLYPVIGVFYANEKGNMMPLAIQLTRKGKDGLALDADKIYTPHEENPDAWLFAKMHYMSADGLYHQMAVHLLQCHLSLEPVIVSMNKHLEASAGARGEGHPVIDLMRPHFHRTIAINSFGRYTMLGGGDEENPPIFDIITTIGVSGTLDLMEKAYTEEWSLVNNAFPEHLKRRGFTRTEPSFLKDFAYKEDGFLIWDALMAYASDAMESYYKDGRTVKDDVALQAWFTAMRTRKAKGGAHVNGVPDKIEDVPALVSVLASIMFQATAQHSAVNFGQWEYYAYVPNRPLALSKAMPEDTKIVDTKFILSALPSYKEVGDMLSTARALTLPTGYPLYSPDWSEGQAPFGHNRFSYAVRFPRAYKKLQSKLGEIEKEVNARNAKRKWPYAYLVPSAVPSSIAI